MPLLSLPAHRPATRAAARPKHRRRRRPTRGFIRWGATASAAVLTTAVVGASVGQAADPRVRPGTPSPASAAGSASLRALGTRTQAGNAARPVVTGARTATGTTPATPVPANRPAKPAGATTATTTSASRSRPSGTASTSTSGPVNGPFAPTRRTSAAGPTSAGVPSVAPAHARRADTSSGLGSGVQLFGMWRDWDTHDRLLDRIAASGTTWIRLDVAWCSLEEAGNGVISGWYQDRLDEMVADTRAHGLQILMTVICTPSWAGPNGLRLPTDTAQFTQLTTYLAQRYAGQVAAYEIWNEPDCQDVGCPNGDPNAYVAVLKAGYRGIKAGDPSALVVSGGISGINIDWLRRMYAAGAQGYFDVLGVHPYIDPANGSPYTPSVPGYTNPYRIPNVVAAHALMASYGDGSKPIWFTEFGWTMGRSSGSYDGVSSHTQALYLTGAYKLVATNYPYVGRMFWYTIRDRDDSSAYENGFGLLTVGGVAKPSYAAFTAINAWLAAR